MRGAPKGLLFQILFLAGLTAALVAYFAVTYAATNGSKVVSGTETRAVEKAPAPVVVARVEPGDVTHEIVAVGTIEAAYRLQVVPEVAGRLLSLGVSEGESVAEGAEVAAVDPALIDLQVRQARAALDLAGISTRASVLEAQRAQAKAGLEAARAGREQVRTRLANLEKERDRLKKLHEGGAVSDSSLDEVETALASLADQEALAAAQIAQAEAGLSLLEAQLEDAAAARETQAQAALDLALLQREKASVRAPRGGVVNRVFVEVGDLVGPTRPLFEIVGIDRVKVVVDLPETVFGRIRENRTPAEIAVEAWPGRPPFLGTIALVGPSLKAASRAVPVEVVIENPDHALRPGMSAKVRVMPEKSEGMLRVPLEAVVDEGGERYVFVLGEGASSVRKTRIETGLSSDRATEVLSGLEAGARIVVRGTVGLRDGSAVTLLEDRD